MLFALVPLGCVTQHRHRCFASTARIARWMSWRVADAPAVQVQVDRLLLL